jgi:MFS family permease
MDPREPADARGDMSSQRRVTSDPRRPSAGPRLAPVNVPLDVAVKEPQPRAAVAYGFRTVLRNRYFLRLWLAQVISQTIMNAANYGLIILVTNQAKSFTATGGAIVAFSLPALIFAAPAGVVVDHLDRRFVLWMSNLLRAIASVIFVISLMINQNALVPVYLLAFFIAMIGQFFAPAEGAAIPRLVRSDELIHALALFNITFTLAQAAGLIVLGPLALLFIPRIHIGPVAAGVTIEPIASLFILIALLYLVCTVLILSIPPYRMKLVPQPLRLPRRQQGEVQRSRPRSRRSRIVAGLIECWRFITRDQVLTVSVWQLALGGSVVAVVAMIAPRFVVEFFRQPPELAALVFVPAGAGLILGSAFTPIVVRRLRYNLTIALGVVTLSLCAVLLTIVHAVAPMLFGQEAFYGAIPYLAIMLLLTFLIGVALDLINVPAQTLMQERSPDWIKGRVLAVQGMLLNGVTVPFVLIMGRVADIIGLPPAILVLAAIIATAGLISVHFGVQGQHKLQQAEPSALPERP